MPSIAFILLLAVWLSPGVKSFAVPKSTTMTTTTATPSSTTLGPTSLRKLVQESSIDTQKQSLDVHGILWLEHLNLIVGDMETATKFYINFLGMTPEREHNVKSNHFNLGQQQFHLAASNNENDVPQRVTGSIGLTVPNLQHIRDRIDIAKDELDGTLFSIVANNDGNSNNILTVTCPWGNIIHLYDISIDDEYCSTEQLESAQQKMVKLHTEGGDYGPHRMAVRGKPGIRYVELTCRKGTVHSIAGFYESIMGCHVTRTEEDVLTVCVGPGVHLIFAEHEQLSDDAIAQMEGVHACIYISNFQKTYDALKKMNMIWTNPRFTHLDSCDTWEEAYASRTFRFKDIISKGEKIFELEHEVRPMMHGQYMKVPPYVPN